MIEYRNELRLTLAKRMRIGTDKSIGEIAQELGFAARCILPGSFQDPRKYLPPNSKNIIGLKNGGAAFNELPRKVLHFL